MCASQLNALFYRPRREPRQVLSQIVLDPKALLEWVAVDPDFCDRLPVDDDADRAMDARDEPATEQAWLREDEAVQRLLKESGAGAASDVSEAVAEAAFRRAFEVSEHHELAAQVSDDMRLLAEAGLVNHRSVTLQTLWEAYRGGAFPTQLR